VALFKKQALLDALTGGFPFTHGQGLGTLPFGVLENLISNTRAKWSQSLQSFQLVKTDNNLGQFT
jgi:hypothetical protein